MPGVKEGRRGRRWQRLPLGLRLVQTCSTHLDIKVPVAAGWQLAHDLSRINIPADGPVVLSTAEQEGCIVRRPGHAQDPLSKHAADRLSRNSCRLSRPRR